MTSLDRFGFCDIQNNQGPGAWCRWRCGDRYDNGHESMAVFQPDKKVGFYQKCVPGCLGGFFHNYSYGSLSSKSSSKCHETHGHFSVNILYCKRIDRPDASYFFELNEYHLQLNMFCDCTAYEHSIAFNMTALMTSVGTQPEALPMCRIFNSFRFLEKS